MPLQRFVEDELARASALAEQAREAAIDGLHRHADGDAGWQPADAQAKHEAAAVLREHGAAYCAAFRAALAELVRGDLAAAVSPAGAAPGPAQGLSLMDEAQVEADIEMSRAAMLIDGTVESEHRELQMFTSTLRGDKHVAEGSNPIRPALVARALWEAGEALPWTVPAQVQALRAMAAAIGEPLKHAFADARKRLEAQGVARSAYRGKVAGIAATAAGAAQPVASGKALRALLAHQPAARPAAAPGAVTRAAGSPTTMPGALAPAAAAALDMRRVGLIAALYDIMLADPELPLAARRPIARLQASTLRMAMRDPGLLDGAGHPTWCLLDRIASACRQAAAAGPARLAAMVARCDGLADELARHPTPDAALHRQYLARLEAPVAEDLREAQQAMAGAIAALLRTERRRQTQAQVQQRMEQQFLRHPVGAATRHWLLGAAAQQIAEAMLDEGPEGPATAALTRNVDDLLWSLHPPDHPASRQRLVRMLPGLIGRLRAVMAQGRVSPAGQQAVLAELEASHSAKLWPAESGTKETPEEIVRRLREEVIENDEDSPRRDFGNSLLDVSTLDTVPAEMMPASRGDDFERAERARAAQRAVATLAPGRAARLLLRGQWHEAQLIWRSADGELLLFADGGARTQALTRSALERLQAEGLAVTDRPFSLVRRAIEALLAEHADGR
jgi:hypothetical protein